MNGRFVGSVTAVSLLILLLAACSVSETSVVEKTNGAEEVLVLATESAVVGEMEEAEVVPVSPTATEAVMLQLPDLGAAPELVNETWLNTDAPVTIASQRGKVILLEFWTFG